MERTKLLVVDSDERFTDSLQRYLDDDSEIEVRCESNGQDALRIIRNTAPDAVLFDLVLPGLDGLSLLRCVNDMQNPPAMICCTRFYSDVALEAVRTYGAAYLLFKPVEMHALRPVVISCAALYKKIRISRRCFEDAIYDIGMDSALIRNYIVSLGVPSKLIGCSYLTEAVRLAKQDASLTRNLSKGLYLEISRNMNTTPSRIERSIRNAISIAFQRGAMEGKMITCPTNKEFINYVLRTIES